VDDLSWGARLDADHPENGVLIPRLITLWVTQHCGGRLSRVTLDGHVTEIGLDGLRAPNGTVVAPDGTVWFALARSNGIGRHRPEDRQ